MAAGEVWDAGASDVGVIKPEGPFVELRVEVIVRGVCERLYGALAAH
jgi:hypothetical protein